MVGGGIFSVLGVVVDRAGAWAWAAFLLGGLVALATGDSYQKLIKHIKRGGGSYAILRETRLRPMAGGLAWVLVAGYVLTMAVYAFTFSHYVGAEFGFGSVAIRALAAVAIAVFVLLNLRGVDGSAVVEEFAVWGKVIVLGGLGLIGVFRWEPSQLSTGIHTVGLGGVILGGAAVFMAYEGFQLLAYDYDEIRDVGRTLPEGMLLAIASVIAIYVLVAVGAAMLVGADTLVAQGETTLSVAGQEVAGRLGRGIVVVAAAFSTGSAINATLLSTAQLTSTLGVDGELPGIAAHRNEAHVPDLALITLGVASALVAMIGSLGSIVEAASLTFLATFALVNGVAAFTLPTRRIVSALGAAGATVGAVVLLLEVVSRSPLALGFLVAFVLLAMVGRRPLMRLIGD
jgi:amino acid transporter